jgi:hypothetical protein
MGHMVQGKTKVLCYLGVGYMKVNVYFVSLSPAKFRCNIILKLLGYVMCKAARKQDIFQ